MTRPLFPSQAIPWPKPIAWRLAADCLVSSGAYVTVQPQNIPDLLPLLKSSTDHAYWRDYASPVDTERPDLGRLFYELALTIAQFGGFTHYRADGTVEAWKLDGSGVKAILATMAAIRTAQKLPGIDIHHDYQRQLAHFLIGTPFASERLAIMTEIAEQAPPAFFTRTLAAVRARDGSFLFNAALMQGLACRLPKAFGEDGEFFKKASLLLMTMEIAMGQLGIAAASATIPPADYRIPQILAAFGILRFDPALVAKLTRGCVFRLDDPEVRAVRAATVQAVGLITHALQQVSGRPVSGAALDGMLYMLSRNVDVMRTDGIQPHLRVATLAF